MSCSVKVNLITKAERTRVLRQEGMTGKKSKRNNKRKVYHLQLPNFATKCKIKTTHHNKSTSKPHQTSKQRILETHPAKMTHFSSELTDSCTLKIYENEISITTDLGFDHSDTSRDDTHDDRTVEFMRINSDPEDCLQENSKRIYRPTLNCRCNSLTKM